MKIKSKEKAINNYKNIIAESGSKLKENNYKDELVVLCEKIRQQFNLVNFVPLEKIKLIELLNNNRDTKGIIILKKS